MVKMITFDIDGTLVPFNQHHLSEEINDMFKRLNEQGIIVTLATGRDFVSIADIYKNKYVDYFIGANGCFIYDVKNKKYLFNSVINFNDYQNFFNDVLLTNEQMISNVVLSDDKKVFVWENIHYNQPWFWEPFRNKFEDINDAQTKIDRDNFHLITVNFNKHVELLKISQDYFKRNNSSLEIQSWWESGFFVANKGINKATTILKLSKMLNIDIKSVWAFGDGENDIEMLETVGHGVAMHNASDYVKSFAKDTTVSVDEYGTKHYLEKRGII